MVNLKIREGSERWLFFYLFPFTLACNIPILTYISGQEIDPSIVGLVNHDGDSSQEGQSLVEGCKYSCCYLASKEERVDTGCCGALRCNSWKRCLSKKRINGRWRSVEERRCDCEEGDKDSHPSIDARSFQVDDKEAGMTRKGKWLDLTPVITAKGGEPSILKNMELIEERVYIRSTSDPMTYLNKLYE